ncbi:hypothetical protein [Enterococcus columbae]|uniref:Uncharacterized protein n=1 Tax=Enterococcus columbae DSM 7374 = ATCC 51263 TaxID=1121865 RepID=S0KIX3_9ENTE|nr:hypothetical protein [Enterococcus columbae]EOT39136.1 hypothetical protein OMW_02013 [Enterococcus columbae DSM 7374 = ATCC 51263]EOW79931.1 hypothetical protein I568_02282 [Enterococcus columbae DSM 7374 = ATCC 51263]OJG24554.1 hypothetical protein RR47_GL000277 [Enterococcus columbae DSM 7374 = ATCC 51263]
MKKLDFFLLISGILEMVVCFYLLNKLTIFQFMFFAQILPSLLLALFMGRIASQMKKKWMLLVLSGIVYAGLMYILIKYTPMSTIEANTVQSASSVFEFNKNIQFGSYVGFFIQEIFLTAFVMLMVKVFNKIKLGAF